MIELNSGSRRCARACRIILAMSLALMIGCGSSDDTTEPQVTTGLALDLAADEAMLGESVEIEASFLYSREAPDCDWFVDDVLGGSVETGTISQGNPAVYTAPLSDPGSESVEITATWQDDESITGTESLDLLIPIVVLSLEQDQIQVAESMELSAELTVDRSAQDFDWYVNDILGGDATVGSISQENPATYLAPMIIPMGGGVEITVKWRDNPDFEAADLVSILFTTKHVNAGTGVDEPGRGQITAPFKTITYANGSEDLEEGDTILLAPGTYDHDLGEDSSISLSSQITLRGSDRDQCFVDADPEHDGAIFYVGYQTVLEDLTLRNAEYPVSTMKYALQFQSPEAVCRNLKINDSFVISAIKVVNNGVNPLIENCELICTQAPGEDDGIACNHDTLPTIRDCSISGWRYGIVVYSASTPLIEECAITGNLTGVLVSSSDANPDLGGGARGSLGGNTIQNNDKGLDNGSTLDIYAKFNTWTGDPPVEGPGEPYDYYSDNGGSVILE